jgi:hypothetical protein
MGIWGPGGFENDDAMEWFGELERRPDTSVLKDALETVEEEDDEDEFVEASESCVGIAAAEIVAALRGKPAASLPEKIATWVKGRPAPSSGLIKRARRAIEIIYRNSELAELWEEAGKAAQWKSEMKSLMGRLG